MSVKIQRAFSDLPIDMSRHEARRAVSTLSFDHLSPELKISWMARGVRFLSEQNASLPAGVAEAIREQLEIDKPVIAPRQGYSAFRAMIAASKSGIVSSAAAPAVASPMVRPTNEEVQTRTYTVGELMSDTPLKGIRSACLSEAVEQVREEFYKAHPDLSTLDQREYARIAHQQRQEDPAILHIPLGASPGQISSLLAQWSEERKEREAKKICAAAIADHKTAATLPQVNPLPKTPTREEIQKAVVAKGFPRYSEERLDRIIEWIKPEALQQKRNAGWSDEALERFIGMMAFQRPFQSKL